MYAWNKDGPLRLKCLFKMVHSEEQGVVFQILAICGTTLIEILMTD